MANPDVLRLPAVRQRLTWILSILAVGTVLLAAMSASSISTAKRKVSQLASRAANWTLHGPGTIGATAQTVSAAITVSWSSLIRTNGLAVWTMPTSGTI